MMRTLLIAALIFMYIMPAAAQDWSGFVASSTRADDPLILQMMDSSDLETSVTLCKAVGGRPDPFIGTIAGSLMSDSKGAARGELLLRVLIQVTFDADLGYTTLSARIAENEAVLDALVGRMPGWQDPQLAGALVRLLPLMNLAGRLSTLADVGNRLIGWLEIGNGSLTPPQTSLGRDYLAALLRLHGSDLLGQCATIARLSRDKALVDAARQAAKTLAAL